MRCRQFRMLGRWNARRVAGIVSACFLLGLVIGLRKPTVANSKTPTQAVDPAIPSRVAEWMKESDLEIPGRKKLSVKADKPVFKRLPPSFERNVYPPRAPSPGFSLEPKLVMERNKNEETGHNRYFMLFIVKSAPIHFSRREVIRRTWGAVKVVNDRTFNTIFVIGNVAEDNEALQKKIEKESFDNGDILQAQIPEGYRKLPTKVLSAMQWLISVSDKVSSDFYTFTDDDCVIHIPNTFDFFSHLRFEAAAVEATTRGRAVASTLAPANEKEIQDVEAYKKMKVNEVTLPLAAIQKGNFSKDGLVSLGGISQSEDRLMQSAVYGSEENRNELPEMDPNAQIQIQRTGREDENENFPDKNNPIRPWRTSDNTTPVVPDEDTFNQAYSQNAYNLTNYLKSSLPDVIDPGAVFQKQRLVPDGIYCGFSYDPHSRPHRQLKSKWGVSMELYSEDCYPAFCHGGMYTMSGARMASIFAISTVTDYQAFHLEDVLVTGILREKAGVRDSKHIRGGPDPKSRPLMYYVWESGPRVMYKMSRKWRYYSRQLLSKRFLMEAMRNGKLVSWKNYGENER